MKTTNPNNNVGSNLVLAQDAFTQFGGAERVFEGAQELYPESPIYTLAVDPSLTERMKNWKVVTSPLQFIYNLHPHLTHLFLMIPVVLEFWKPKQGKVLLSFSSSYIKGLKKPKGAVHINYCHTPTRFLWIDPEQALKEIPSFLHKLAKLYFGWLKQWDLVAANNVNYFIANSREVQRRIKQVYNRDSEIVYPFVDVNFWKPTIAKQDYFLIAGRLQYAKGLEIVIEAFNELGWPLHVVGTGRYESHLKKIAKSNVKFFGKLADEQLRDQYSGAKGFIYPQFEDFGMMPLEAAACGTATIGLAKGGSLETIIPNETGELLESITAQTLIEALRSWNHEKYQQDNMLAHAQKFSKQIFQEKLSAIVTKHLGENI
ncbi:MAG TPA: glycosyltransferase [Patescibacteria group bacterium]|nr:glycosyltransferase [Patescibacteria group bacterium]